MLTRIICTKGHGHVMDGYLHVLSAELCFLTASFPSIHIISLISVSGARRVIREKVISDRKLDCIVNYDQSSRIRNEM